MIRSRINVIFTNEEFCYYYNTLCGTNHIGEFLSSIISELLLYKIILM